MVFVFECKHMPWAHGNAFDKSGKREVAGETSDTAAKPETPGPQHPSDAELAEINAMFQSAERRATLAEVLRVVKLKPLPACGTHKDDAVPCLCNSHRQMDVSVTILKALENLEETYWRVYDTRVEMAEDRRDGKEDIFDCMFRAQMLQGMPGSREQVMENDNHQDDDSDEDDFDIDLAMVLSDQGEERAMGSSEILGAHGYHAHV